MALIPPFFLNTVVALGRPSPDGSVRYSATGFLYGYPTGETNENGEKTYWIYLITNRHVTDQLLAEQATEMKVRFNRPMGAVPSVYSLPLKNEDGSLSWTVHQDTSADVAVLGISARQLRADGIEYAFFNADQHTFSLEQARSSEISEGDGIFVLGFPLGQAGEERNYAIARQGIVARIQDWLKGDARQFLIDASIFPGNSGGPVLTKPEATAIHGTMRNDRCALIGMVSSYLTYSEVAISQQTGRQRMVFEENSGLGVVVPHDVIQETIKSAVEKLTPQPIAPNL